MNAEIKPVYEFSNRVEVAWCSSPELAIMSSFGAKYPPADKFGKFKTIDPDPENLKEISMGMSEDYMEAIKHSSTYLRIGSKIFGQRS